MRTIIIEMNDGNDFNVREGERFCARLCWDEMLGHIVAMTAPLNRMSHEQGLYRMLSQKERDEIQAARDKREAEQVPF